MQQGTLLLLKAFFGYFLTDLNTPQDLSLPKIGVSGISPSGGWRDVLAVRIGDCTLSLQRLQPILAAAARVTITM